MSITLEVDEQTLRALPLGPGERERHMQIELASRYYAKGWLSFGQAARMAGLDQFAFACELAERDIPRKFAVKDALEDLADWSVYSHRFQLAHNLCPNFPWWGLQRP
jgi:predicted HTH domain antitoxin